MDTSADPGSEGERLMQDVDGSRERADRFYADQLLDTLTETMITFVGRQTRMIVASADPQGHPDASVRFGERGFVTVLDPRTLCWPELRGNGVHTTLGNLAKNPWAHLMFLDADERIGLHLRGAATILETADMAQLYPAVTARPMTGRAPERWVVLHLQTSYIHCRKHFPQTEGTVEWGTDDSRAKGGDYFGAKDVASPWAPGD